MKKILKYISLVVVMFAFQSCEDFLSYKNKDMLIPSNLDHYDELIYGELIKKGADDCFFRLDIMSDDITDAAKTLSSSETDERILYSNWYRWSKDPQKDINGGKSVDGTWAFLYHKVLMCNIIENEVGTFGVSELSNRLLGEVKFIRAMSYFYLINMYGMPYKDKNQAATALGVPINTELSIRQNRLTRSTVAQVYGVIEKDLIDAIELLGKGDGKFSKFRPNIDVAKLLLARTYLFIKQYDNAITVATDLLSTTRSQTVSLSEMSTLGCFYNSENKGIIFNWGYANKTTWYVNSGKSAKYTTSKELLDMYHTKDKRRSLFFGQWYNECVKSDGYYMNIYRRGFRIEEAYLIRAEAYAENGEYQLALDDINELRRNRIDAQDYKRSSNDPETVMNYIRDERRMELCFEEMRWFDIRRWELEITHTYKDINNPQNMEYFVLRKGSPNYVLPIPVSETDINDKIERLERVDCKVSAI